MEGDNMLEINMEFRKGILFVRLEGILDKTTVTKLNAEVTELVRDNGIRNLVFNISGLNSIDMKGINALFYNYELCNQNNGKSLLCGFDNTFVSHRIKNSRLLNYMYEASDELSAILMMNL